MNAASTVYSAAHALRTGGSAPVRAALLAARERTLLLADAYTQALASQGFRVPYRETLNPPLWEWGHVAWFQEWWIARNRERSRGVLCDPAHARLPSLMPGADDMYDSSRVAHRLRWELALPGPQATRDFLGATLGQTLSALDDLGGSPGDDELYFFRLVALHEEMHAEAAIYMARSLGIDVPSSVLRALPVPARGPTVLRVEGGEFIAGWSGDGFAFDNELQAHTVRIDGFEIDANPVSWGRFHEFARAGGYTERRWWDDGGWAWLQRHGAPAHATEARDDDAAANHITAFEADAWCRWAGRRLPTEHQWEFAALTQPEFRWGEVWEWTSSRFEPYAGFTPHPYRDYSAPWFGSRRMLRGASTATAASLAHPKYRNFFEPQRADVFAGFRSCA